MRHFLPLLPLAIVACGDSGSKSAPTGQVVARVGGEDVTVGELNAELAEARLPSGGDRTQLERQAVQAIVDRKLLVNEAKNRKIEENPAYLLQKRRADELLLVKMLRDQISSSVPRPSRAEAETYINDHPTLFGGRKLYILDQIQFAATSDPEMIKRISATKSLDELEQLLIGSGLEYRRTPASLDTVAAPEAIATQISKLPQGEVFVVRQGPAFVANRIVETRPTPFSGEKAIEFAQNRLRAERVQERLRKEAKAITEKGKETVTYQDKYKPVPAKPAGVATGTAAVPAATAPAAQ